MAYYSEDLIDEILASTDIVEVVNEYVPLKRRGANYLGLCPFHKEKTPSFTVSADKQIYKCFGCGQGGTVIQFVSKLENLDFRETLETLAERANIDLEKYKTNTTVDPKKDLRDTILEINKSTARYFFDALTEEVKKEKSILKDYLIKRDLDSKTITRFGLGYGSKSSETLMAYLTRLGYKKEDILAAGVVSKNMRGDIYENFAGRLIFPIFDTRDRVIAFGGRVLDNSLPKYVNSPENALYHKGSNLYGMNVAKKEQLNSVIIVEGYMDTVAPHKSGITNVVASLGTAFTEKQAKLLKKYTDTVIISYDQDAAGQNATLRAIDILVKEGLKVKVLRLDKEDAKDPDEYIKKYGKERFEECVKKSISHIEYKISRMEKLLEDDNNFDNKVKFLSRAADILATLENDIEREMYVDTIAKKYNVSKAAIESEINKKIKKNVKEEKVVKVKEKVAERKEKGPLTLRKKQEEYIVAMLLGKDKKMINQVLDRFKERDFVYEDVRNLFIFLKELNNEQDITKINVLTRISDSDTLNLITEILAINLSDFDKDKLYTEMDKTFKKYYYQNRREEIFKELEKENISKDEKEFLEVELKQIMLKIAKMK
ncbi:MAG: DNA primase [Clostridia bacterium]|nr:DNA primase [Clostridia bacterium]